MTGEEVSTTTDALLKIWVVIGPVVAALLATWLTQRHQLRLEARHEKAAISASIGLRIGKRT